MLLVLQSPRVTIFILQKVDAASTFFDMKFIVRRGGNTGNKQLQLETQYLLRDKLQEIGASISRNVVLYFKNPVRRFTNLVTNYLPPCF